MWGSLLLYSWTLKRMLLIRILDFILVLKTLEIINVILHLRIKVTTLLFNNYEKLLGEKETWMILSILYLIAYLWLRIKTSWWGLPGNKGILSAVCFRSSWPSKKKDFSSKSELISLSAAFWSEIYPISVHIFIIFYSCYSYLHPW